MSSQDSNPKSDFVHLNAIRLHYLDWSGASPMPIFLTGMGFFMYIFNKFAPHFTDRFCAQDELVYNKMPMFLLE